MFVSIVSNLDLSFEIEKAQINKTYKNLRENVKKQAKKLVFLEKIVRFSHFLVAVLALLRARSRGAKDPSYFWDFAV